MCSKHDKHSRFNYRRNYGKKRGRGRLCDQLMSMRIFNLSLDIKPEKYEESGYGLYFDMLIVLY